MLSDNEKQVAESCCETSQTGGFPGGSMEAAGAAELPQEPPRGGDRDGGSKTSLSKRTTLVFFSLVHWDHT